MIVFGAVLVAVWLGVLTMVVAALVRQTTALQLALQQRSPETFSPDSDGPPVGSTMAESILDLVRGVDVDADGPVGLLVLSSTCGPCREIITSFDQAAHTGVPVVAFVAGSGAPLSEVAGLARERFDGVVAGGPGDQAAQEMGVQSSPFAVYIKSGVVVGKTYVRQVADIYDITKPADLSTPLEMKVPGGAP